MRVRLMPVLLALLLAACEGGGVEIVVYPPAEAGATKPDEVRLYVGLGAGEATREQTQAFQLDTKHHGELWQRDMDYDVMTPSGPDAPVRFTYESRRTGDEISVIAVGMTGGKPTSAVARYEMVVPTAHVAVYAVGLNPAVLAGPQAVGINQVELWGPDQGDASCVQLVDYRADHADPRYRVSFIASPGDEDCDGFRAGDKAECDDHAYRSTVTPTIANLSCVSDKPYSASTGQTMSACRFGGLDCTDGDAAGRVDCRLDKRAYCAPQSLCDRCVTASEDKPFECAIDPVGPNPNMMSTAFAFQCAVPTADTANGIVQCAATYSLVLTSGMPSSCANPMWHGARKSDGWQTKIPLGDGELSLAVGGNLSACQVVMGTVTPPKPDDVPAGGLLAIDLSSTRGMVVPVVFYPESIMVDDSCPTTPVPVQCTPRQSLPGDLDTMHACISQAPITP